MEWCAIYEKLEIEATLETGSLNLKGGNKLYVHY